MHHCNNNLTAKFCLAPSTVIHAQGPNIYSIAADTLSQRCIFIGVNYDRGSCVTTSTRRAPQHGPISRSRGDVGEHRRKDSDIV